MTIQEFKEKYKEDKDALKIIDDLEARINKNYVEDNLKLTQENQKLKMQNELLYNQCINGAKKTEEEEQPRFSDYSKEIDAFLRNKK